MLHYSLILCTAIAAQPIYATTYPLVLGQTTPVPQPLYAQTISELPDQSTAELPVAGQTGIVILGPALTPAPPSPTGAAIVVAPGRFLAITPADGSPSYIAPSPGYVVFRVKPGGQIIGIKWDAPANATEASYEWPDVKGPVYCLVASRVVTGQFPVQLVKNGSVENGPIENGPPITMQVGQLPIPPPVPPPVPPPPLPPLDPFAVALQAAYNQEADPSKASQVVTLADFYRKAATTTVNNPALKTMKDLQDTLKVAVKQIGLPAGSLGRVVLVIDADQLRALGKNPSALLDPTMRSLAAVEFLRIASALEMLR